MPDSDTRSATLTVRALTPADGPAFAALRQRGLVEAPWAFAAAPADDMSSDPERVAQCLAPGSPSHVLGAFDPELVGVAGLHCSHHAKCAHKVSLWGMFVAAEHRGRGVGRRLLDVTIAWARSQGFAAVQLGVSVDAPGARRLYARAGFRTWGFEPAGLRVDGRFLGEQHMMLWLDDRPPAIAQTPEFRLIRDYYGARRSRRSQVPLINHILDGLAVLAAIGADPLARRAFCLHPMLQADADLTDNLAHIATAGVDAGALALAIEYRSVANAFLSPMEDHPGYADPAAIRLGPMPAVRDMLIADKVQNYSDFLRHHATTHPRAHHLERYFRAWLARLDVDDARLQALMAP